MSKKPQPHAAGVVPSGEMPVQGERVVRVGKKHIRVKVANGQVHVTISDITNRKWPEVKKLVAEVATKNMYDFNNLVYEKCSIVHVKPVKQYTASKMARAFVDGVTGALSFGEVPRRSVYSNEIKYRGPEVDAANIRRDFTALDEGIHRALAGFVEFANREGRPLMCEKAPTTQK